jgi:aspartyl-tRNA(Asn)/glutamyl-tRNA(Gln) amidotransferase subunit C
VFHGPESPFRPRSGASHARISPEAVRHVAKLARIRVSDADAERLGGELTAILGHVAKLEAIDVAGVEPMAHPLPLVNRFGDDEPVEAMPVEDLLRNAPAREGRFLAVPKVLGDGGGA